MKLIKWIILLFVIFLCSCNYSVSVHNNKEYENELFKLAENAYFEGQKDAINGDIRIKLNSDSTYVWIKSPWDIGRTPVFIPTRLDSNK